MRQTTGAARIKGIAVGVSAAAAAVSIILAVAGWVVVAHRELDHDPQLDLKPWVPLAVAVAAAVVVVGSTSRRGGVRLLSLLVGIGVAVVAVRIILRIGGARADLRLGGAVGTFTIWEASLVCSALAGVLTLALIFNSAPIARRSAAMSFVVTVLLLGVRATGWSYHGTGDVWQPAHTAAAAPVAPIPNGLGAERYRLDIGHSDIRDEQITPAGNGFVRRTKDGIAAYDGPTGAVRWRIGVDSFAVTWRNRADVTGLVVFSAGLGALDLVAVDAGTGNPVWFRRLPAPVDGIVGGHDSLGVTLVNADRNYVFYSLDPATGRTRWTGPTDTDKTEVGLSGQFVEGGDDGSALVDARNGKRTSVPWPYPKPLGDDAYSSSTLRSTRDSNISGTVVFDNSGRKIDAFAGEPVTSPVGGVVVVMQDPENSRQPLPAPILRDYRHQKSIQLTWWPAMGNIMSSGVTSDRFVLQPWQDDTIRMVDTAGNVVATRKALLCEGEYNINLWNFVPVPGAVLAVPREDSCSERKLIGLT